MYHCYVGMMSRQWVEYQLILRITILLNEALYWIMTLRVEYI